MEIKVAKSRTPAGPDVRPADHGRVDQLLAGTADAGRQAPGADAGHPGPALRRDGELDLSDEEAALLVAMSAATIDRRLAGERAKLIPSGRPHTKPGSLLKSQIPVRTWAQWDDAVPGFVEIDMVGHEGGNASGEHHIHAHGRRYRDRVDGQPQRAQGREMGLRGP